MTTLFSCSSNVQEEIMITRFRTYNNSDIRIQEIYIKGNKTIWEKNYSYNGWQVLDSIVYGENETVTYEPQYGDDREFLKYSKRGSTNELTSKSNAPFKYPLKDRYELGRLYSNDIVLIYELLGTKTFETKSENVLKTNFVPSILTMYGIPYDELLDYCTYSVTKKGLLQNDNFYFENFSVSRDFDYEGLVLKKVNIVRVDKVNNQTERFIEKFKIEKIKTIANTQYSQ